MPLSAIDFCYWLQGAIEIGELKCLDARGAGTVLERLDQVAEQNYFTVACKVILERFALDEGFPAISKELQSVFRHDIDRSYEGDQDLFHAVHGGGAISANEEPGS